jgi:hypothetical protein
VITQNEAEAEDFNEAKNENLLVHFEQNQNIEEKELTQVNLNFKKILNFFC